MRWSLLAAVVLASSPLAVAQPVLLPASGQEQCFDSGGAAIPCAGTAQDGDLRPGLPWPQPRFRVTYCSAAGPCPSQAADCDGNPATDVVTDLLTGLDWPRDPQLVGLTTWEGALAAAAVLTLCGHADWRLPNVNEAISLIRREEAPYDVPPVGPKTSAAWLELQGFLPFAISWTSTTYTYNPTIAQAADFFHGDDSGEFKTATLNALPVRRGGGVAAVPRTGQTTCWDANGQSEPCLGTGQDGELQTGVWWPVPRFSDQGDGTVFDRLTGLVWLEDTDCLGTASWSGALAAVADFQLHPSSYPCTDYVPSDRQWRLPTIVELRSLVDRSRHSPALPLGHPFLGVPLYANFWSSTSCTHTLATSNAWILFVTNGISGGNVKGSTNSIWPVSGSALGLQFTDGFETGSASGWDAVVP